MTTLPVGAVATFADWAKRLEDGYKIATIIEMLSQTNEILLDMLVLEGNLPTGHKTTVRTGLPSATWRILNYGVPTSKSTTAPIVDTVGNLEAYAQVDKDLADLAGNTSEWRASEAVAFLEGMNQQMAQTLIYGNQAVNPERFTGLAPRYNSVLTATAQTAANVVDMGGLAGTNTSMWLVTWGKNTTHGIFPKGKTTGLIHRDLGEDRVFDANNNSYQAYVDHFKWELGLTVRDWRYNARLANIDVALLNDVAAPNLINGLLRALYRLPTASPAAQAVQTSDTPSIAGQMGSTVIYANRVLRTYLDLQAMNKSNVFLTLENFSGKVVTMVRGIPVRTVDALLNTEARIV